MTDWADIVATEIVRYALSDDDLRGLIANALRQVEAKRKATRGISPVARTILAYVQEQGRPCRTQEIVAMAMERTNATYEDVLGYLYRLRKSGLLASDQIGVVRLPDMPRTDLPTPMEARLLRVLNVPRTSSQVAEMCGITKAVARTTLRRMYRLGLVTRRPGAEQGAYYYKRAV